MFKWLAGTVILAGILVPKAHVELEYCNRFTRHDPCEVRHNRKPTPTPIARPTATPRPTAKPTPIVLPTVMPTPTANPKAAILSVIVHNCSVGSSCYGWTTGVEVLGSAFAPDTRLKLASGSAEFSGLYQGSSSNQILTDFNGLAHCSTFDAVVFGSTGVATASGAVSTVCP